MSAQESAAQRENEQTFLEYSARFIAQELVNVTAALEEDASIHADRLFQDRIRQLKQDAALVDSLVQEDSTETLEVRLDRLIHADQRRAMHLASRVYEHGRYPADYWAVDTAREFLTALLSAWHHWNDPDYKGPILNV
jgi:hypothetical protein